MSTPSNQPEAPAQWNPLELNGLESACFSLAYSRIPKRLLPKGKKGPSALVNALSGSLAGLTQRFNHGEKLGKTDYLSDDAILYAYSLQFLPLNALRVQLALDESLRSGWQPSPKGTLRILDLGSGPGSAAFAALNMVMDHPSFAAVERIEVVAVDRSRKALTLGKELVERLSEESKETLQWTTIVHDFHRSLLPLGHSMEAPFDLILCANVLNELPFGPPKRQRMAQACISLLNPTGLLVFIEPATMEESRNLIALRASLRGIFSIAPCPGQTRCPYHAERPQDWCHTAYPLPEWPWLVRLDQHTGLDHSLLTFSYWTGSPTPPVAESPRPIRVISDMLISDNKRFRWVCKPDGMHKEEPRRIFPVEPLARDDSSLQTHPYRGQSIRFGTPLSHRVDRDEDTAERFERRSDSPRKERSDSPRKERSDSPRKERGDSPRKERSDSPRKERGDSPRKERSDSPRKERSDSPRKERSDSPRKERSDSPRKERSDSPRKERSDSPRKERSDSPRKERSDSPRKERPAPKRKTVKE